MSGSSLYQRLLGPDFHRLPTALRRFHGSANGGVGAGLVDVQAGPKLWTRVLARALRLPPQGHRVPVTVCVRPVGDREVWDRTFGTNRLRSIQWVEHGRLLERVGALTFTFDVRATEAGMQFRFASLAAFGVPLPERFALRVDADVAGFDRDWHVTVVIRASGSQLLTSYAGRIAPDPST